MMSESRILAVSYVINLFEKDVSDCLKSETKKLQDYFQSRIEDFSNVQADKKLQQKINRWQNLKAYDRYYGKLEGIDAIIKDEVNRLYNTYQAKLDKPHYEFVAVFSTQFFQSTFELVMAGRIGQQFNLPDHLRVRGMPDFVFDKQFLECTTRVTGETDKWDNLLPNIDHFFNILKIIAPQGVNDEYWYFKHNIRSSWLSLSLEEKASIVEGLNKITNIRYNIDDVPGIVNKIDELIFINRYARFNFGEIIPNCLAQKFEAFNFPQGLGLSKIGLNDTDFYFLTKSVAQCICGKLQKEYFLEDKGSDRKQGILAISLAGIRFDLLLPFCEKTAEEFFNYFYENISAIFPSVVEESKEIDPEKIAKGLKNLFAILINVNTYDWSPVLQANYSGNIKNTYIVIYNTDFLEDGTYNDGMFGSFARHREVLPLSTLYRLEEVASISAE
jgi:hypothetical protein